MFHLKQIEALLDKYWEGDTSLEEERLLKSYFASREVDASLRQYAPLFQVLREEQSVQLSQQPVIADLRPQQYNWRPLAAAASVVILLAAGIWWSVRPDTTEQYVQETVTLPAPPAPIQEVHAVETPQATIASTAPASYRKKKTYARSETPALTEEEERAMAEIKAALALVSTKLKKGRVEAAKGATYLDGMDKIFKKKKDSDG